MATQKFIEYPNGPRGVTLTRRAEATILFNKLVKKGTAADQVVVNTAATTAILGIAKPDAVVEDANSAEQYVATNVVQVETLIPGQVYYGFAAGAIAINDFVTGAAGGDIADEATPTTRTVNTIGIALEAISDDTWGKFLCIKGA